VVEWSLYLPTAHIVQTRLIDAFGIFLYACFAPDNYGRILLHNDNKVNSQSENQPVPFGLNLYNIGDNDDDDKT
jgi:hypothetical protein